MARNPKDVIVSNYHHFKLFKFHDFKGSLEDFAQYSMDGQGELDNVDQISLSVSNRFLVYYSPYFPHVLEAWSKRHHPNVLFLFYEEMKQVSYMKFLTKFD